MGVKPPFLFSLSRHSKQAGDERNLICDVPFFHTIHLPFPDHVHDLVSLQRVPCGLKRKEAQPGFDASFNEAMILFDDGVEILDADVSSQESGMAPCACSSLKAFG